MKLLIHDLEPQVFESLITAHDSQTVVISDNQTIKQCMGCFGCWIKTPGVCVLKDDYSNMGKLMSECQEMIIISRCLYGSYSPFIRNVLDRSISFLLPYFTIIKGLTHHKRRYKNRFDLTVYFYSDDWNAEEKATAKALVNANSLNMHTHKTKITFHDSIQSIKEALS